MKKYLKIGLYALLFLVMINVSYAIRVNGEVRDNDGNPVESVLVYFMGDPNNNEDNSYGMETDSSGLFMFPSDSRFFEREYKVQVSLGDDCSELYTVNVEPSFNFFTFIAPVCLPVETPPEEVPSTYERTPRPEQVTPSSDIWFTARIRNINDLYDPKSKLNYMEGEEIHIYSGGEIEFRVEGYYDSYYVSTTLYLTETQDPNFHGCNRGWNSAQYSSFARQTYNNEGEYYAFLYAEDDRSFNPICKETSR